ncbi:hypothetical protein LINPERPRIM_LOCUS21648 [Linum perenne]
MEDPDVGRTRNRQGKQQKPQLIRIHGGFNIGGLVLFGGALVAAYLFRKTKAADQNAEEDKEEQLTSNDKEANHSEDAPPTAERTIEDCQGGSQGQMLVDDGRRRETYAVTFVEKNDNCATDDSCSSFPILKEESSPAGKDEETATEQGKLPINEDIPDRVDDGDDKEDDDANNRKERGCDDGSQASLCATFGSTYEGRDREFDDMSGGQEENLEQVEAEAFDPETNPLLEQEMPEMQVIEEKDEETPGGIIRKPSAATESNPEKYQAQNDIEVLSIMMKNHDIEDNVIEEADCQKTEDGVIEEVDGYIEDNDMDDMENEEDDSTSSSEGQETETEKDELEIWGGSETCSTESNAEAIWPAESIESLALALDDQMTRLKKSAEEGINNQNNHSNNSNSRNNNNSSQSEILEEEEDTYDLEATERTMLLEKPMVVNGQIAELVSRRSWIFPMLMLLIVALLLLFRRNALSYQANAI